MFRIQHFVILLVCICATKAGVINNQKHDQLFRTEDSQLQRVFEDQILEVLENLRDIVLNGNDDVPVLDPFAYEGEIKIDLREIGIAVDQGTLEFRNIGFTGLGGFVVNRLSFGLLTQRLTFDISFPELVLTTDNYDLDFKLAGTQIFGAGPARVAVRGGGISGTVSVSIGIISGISVSSADVVVRVEEAESQIQGLLGGSAGGAFINNIIEQLIPELVNAYESDISAVLNTLIVEIANDILRSGNTTIFKQIVTLFPGILDTILPL